MQPVQSIRQTKIPGYHPYLEAAAKGAGIGAGIGAAGAGAYGAYRGVKALRPQAVKAIKTIKGIPASVRSTAANLASKAAPYAILPAVGAGLYGAYRLDKWLTKKADPYRNTRGNAIVYPVVRGPKGQFIRYSPGNVPQYTQKGQPYTPMMQPVAFSEKL